MQQKVGTFEEKGAVLAAISADPLSETEEWQRNEDPEDRITFPLLADPSLNVIREYGVHDRDNEIALPAVFLVGHESGLIHWKHVGESLADRPAETVVLEKAEELSQTGRVTPEEEE